MMINIKQKLSPYRYRKLISVDQDLKLHIAKQMQTYGGSFVKALGNALMYADPLNTMKLVDAFSGYFYEYSPDVWDIELLLNYEAMERKDK